VERRGHFFLSAFVTEAVFVIVNGHGELVYVTKYDAPAWLFSGL
jgi:hypothetical protein